MTQIGKRGFVQFCVNLGDVEGRLILNEQDRSFEIASRMQAQFRRHGIRATWAVPATASLPLLELLASADEDLALSAGAEWISPAHSRAQVEATLRTALDRFRSLGLGVRTLVAADTSIGEHWELLGNAGFRVIRQGRAVRGLRGMPSRKGKLWQVPITADLPGTGKFLGRWDRGYRAKASLHRAMTRRTTEHVALDASGWSEGATGRAISKSLDRVLLATQRLNVAGKIVTETVSTALSRWLPITTSRPQSSVLRPAA